MAHKAVSEARSLCSSIFGFLLIGLDVGCQIENNRSVRVNIHSIIIVIVLLHYHG